MTVTSPVAPTELEYEDYTQADLEADELEDGELDDTPLKDGELDPETGLRFIAYPVEGDEVPASNEQFDLVVYLTDVIRELYYKERWHVMGDVCIRKVRKSHPLCPDVAVCKVRFTRSTKPRNLRTWKMWLRKWPAPAVVFEISSRNTWPQDIILEEKPTKYQWLGVNEYFAYDPGIPPHWKDMQGRRLRGWRYTSGTIEEIEPNEQGWLRSLELNSWLVPDDEYLLLFDLEGNQRPTQSEAATQREEAEREGRLSAEQRAEAQFRAKEAERRAKEAERRARLLAEQQEQAERHERLVAEQQTKAERQARLLAEQQEQTAHRARLLAEQQEQAEHRARLLAEQQEQAERHERLVAEQQTKAERQAKEAAQVAMQELRAKLQKMGIDPDKL